MSDTEIRSADLIPGLEENATKLHELRSIPADKRDDTWAADVKRTHAEVVAADAEFSIRQRLEQDQLQRMAFEAAIAGAALGKSTGPDGAMTPTGEEIRGIVGTIQNDPRYAQLSEQFATGQGNARDFFFKVEGRSIHNEEFRTTLTTNTGDGVAAGLLMGVAQPIPPVPRQLRMFVRDLIGAVPTSFHAVPYVRELNPATTETTASTVAENTAKPEVEMDFVADTAVMQVIAAFIPATMQILADAPAMQGYIFARLAYMIKLREQAEILYGNGLGQDLKGINLYAGIQTAGPDAADPFKTMATGAGKVENVDLEATGIAMNPLDYWSSMSLRHSTFFDGNAFGGGGNSPFGGPPGTIWGLPVVRSRTIPTTQAFIADWSMGATIFDRMETTIRTSDSHSTFFTSNLIAVLAEERVGLAVFRPDAFVRLTLAFS